MVYKGEVMFIVDTIKAKEATGELKLLYKIIQKSLGFIPPHFELLATIDLAAMKEFMASNHAMMTHPFIDKNLLPFLRLYIATKESRRYCIDFNTQLLLRNGVDVQLVYHLIDKIEDIPFDEKQKSLLHSVLKALYHSAEFGKDDLEALHVKGWSDKDFFDLLHYATNFMSKSKLIEVYSK